jgi:hypothetical protein
MALMSRATHVLQWRYRGKRTREVEPIPKSVPQFGLESATRLHEVGIASNRGSARRGEYVPGPCTHRPSHHESWFTRSRELTARRQRPKVVDDWGEVVTR